MNPRLATLVLIGVSSMVSCARSADPAQAGETAEVGALELTLENINRNNRGARSVAISPDGLWVAVSGNGPDGSGIYLVSTSDTEESARFWLPGQAPHWSPDGERIVFTRSGELWIAGRGSTEASALTTDMNSARAPVFSPDGRTVAFYSGKSGHQDIWLMSADGSEAPRQLTHAAMALDDPRFDS